MVSRNTIFALVATVLVAQSANGMAKRGRPAKVKQTAIALVEAVVPAQKNSWYANLLSQAKTNAKDYARLARGYASQFTTSTNVYATQLAANARTFAQQAKGVTQAQVAKLDQLASPYIAKAPAASYGLFATAAAATVGAVGYGLSQEEKQQLAEKSTIGGYFRGLLKQFEFGPAVAAERVKTASTAAVSGAKTVKQTVGQYEVSPAVAKERITNAWTGFKSAASYAGSKAGSLITRSPKATTPVVADQYPQMFE